MRNTVTTEAWLPDFLLAFLNLNEALWVGLFEPLPNLVEQTLNIGARPIDCCFPGLGFCPMFLGVLL